MAPWVGGRSLRAQRYMKEGDVWAKMESPAQGFEGILYFPRIPVNNSGQNSQDPASHVRTRRGVRGFTHFPQHYAVPQEAAR
jgi:hypothetical protein